MKFDSENGISPGTRRQVYIPAVEFPVALNLKGSRAYARQVYIPVLRMLY